MTALDVPAIRALHAAHYQGFEYGDDIAEGGDEEVPEDYERHFCHEDGEDWPCPAFIAAAPSIVTQLLAVVDDVLAISDIGMNSNHGDPAFIQGWECAIEEMKARIATPRKES